ncbi:hypothetical protein NXV03_20065 [Phocaeicola vulgatus]|nr:hypothetical protein [Phocaeicola vulgatus]
MNRYTCKVIVSLIGDIPIDYLTKRDIRETLFKGMQAQRICEGEYTDAHDSFQGRYQ